MAEFVPGHAATRGRTVEVARGQGGNFVVTTQVNGARAVDDPRHRRELGRADP